MIRSSLTLRAVFVMGLALPTLACSALFGPDDAMETPDVSGDTEGPGEDAPEVRSVSARCENDGELVSMEVRTDGVVDSVTVSFFEQASALGSFELEEGVEGSWFLEVTSVEIGRNCDDYRVDYNVNVTGPGGSDESSSFVI